MAYLLSQLLCQLARLVWHVQDLEPTATLSCLQIFPTAQHLNYAATDSKSVHKCCLRGTEWQNMQRPFKDQMGRKKIIHLNHFMHQRQCVSFNDYKFKTKTSKFKMLSKVLFQTMLKKGKEKNFKILTSGTTPN